LTLGAIEQRIAATAPAASLPAGYILSRRPLRLVAMLLCLVQKENLLRGRQDAEQAGGIWPAVRGNGIVLAESLSRNI
jgi:hypothetical protein